MPSTAGNAGLQKGCSLWPAFWMFGPNWPADGEIDIVEFVNNDSKVATTLHTTDNCTQANEDSSLFSGTVNGPTTTCISPIMEVLMTTATMQLKISI